jgi:3-hydroxyisobutyrate dehydrogenase-like beta-hydroxyacid dehydrogenase
MQPPPVGLIGLGVIGSALARRLIPTGQPVIGWDPDPARTYLLGAMTGTATNAREVFERCQRVIIALADGNTTLDVIYRHADAFLPGLLLIDTTGGDPEPTARLAREVQSRGTRYVDATVIGSADQAQAGQMLVLCGGSPADAAAARELLSVCSRQVYHVGGHGAGARLKLVISMVLGLNRVALAEGLSFARRCGLNLEVVLEMLRNSAAYSRVMDTKGDKMLRGDFSPQTRLAHHLKEIRLLLAEATRNGAPLPLTTQHQELLERVVAMGNGEEDNCAVVRAYGWVGGLESSGIWRTLPGDRQSGDGDS